MTVQGRIKLSGLPKDHVLIPVSRDGDYCGETFLGEAEAVDPSTNGFGNAIVSLEGVERGKPLAPSESPLILEIESRKCRFSPHVSAAAVGTTLEVRNLDPILHNLHGRRETRFGPTVMNVIQPADTRSVQKPFSETGFLDVRCDVHAFMSAFVHVFDHPYFATTDPTGSFAMTKVPPGVYKLQIWHEQFGTRERTINVPPGENVTVEMEIGGKNLAPSYYETGSIMGHLGRVWRRMSHVDQWLQSCARMTGTLHPFLNRTVLASTHNTLDDGLRGSSDFGGRLRTTAKYTYTDNRFSGMTGHLALLELQANW